MNIKTLSREYVGEYLDSINRTELDGTFSLKEVKKLLVQMYHDGYLHGINHMQTAVDREHDAMHNYKQIKM